MDAPTPDNDTLPANLKFLRRLVTILTGTMIVGLVVVIALLVIRLQPASVPLPDEITLPDGATAVSFTQAQDWYAVVTDANKILIFDRMTGDIRQTFQIDGATSN